MLILKSGLLHPLNNGGRIRTYHTLRHLMRDHHITYIGLDEPGAVDPQAHRLAGKYCHELIAVPHHRPSAKGSMGLYVELVKNLFSRLPHFVAKKRSIAMEGIVQERLKQRKDDVLICDALSVSCNVPAGPWPIQTILYQHNVETMIWQRLADVQTQLPQRSYLRGQWKKTFAYERDQCRRFDQVIAVSPDDATEMQSAYGIEHAPVVPLGVDVEYFKPNMNAPPPRPRSLVFSGAMDYLPNDDGMQWFLEKIWPTVYLVCPDASLTIVGRDPTGPLKQLADRAPGCVKVTGTVEDVRPFMQAASVAIVPLRVGGGTRLKIYEALAMEKPIISTTIGAEGLPLQDGIHFLRADGEEAFAAGIVKLFKDKKLADRLASQGAHLVRTKFDWSCIAQKLAAICEDVVAKRSNVQ